MRRPQCLTHNGTWLFCTTTKCRCVIFTDSTTAQHHDATCKALQNYSTCTYSLCTVSCKTQTRQSWHSPSAHTVGSPRSHGPLSSASPPAPCTSSSVWQHHKSTCFWQFNIWKAQLIQWHIFMWLNCNKAQHNNYNNIRLVIIPTTNLSCLALCNCRDIRPAGCSTPINLERVHTPLLYANHLLAKPPVLIKQL